MLQPREEQFDFLLQKMNNIGKQNKIFVHIYWRLIVPKNQQEIQMLYKHRKLHIKGESYRIRAFASVDVKDNREFMGGTSGFTQIVDLLIPQGMVGNFDLKWIDK